MSTSRTNAHVDDLGTTMVPADRHVIGSYQLSAHLSGWGGTVRGSMDGSTTQSEAPPA